MKEKIRTLLEQYKEFVAYVVFGVFTTIVNIGVFWLFSDVVGIYYMFANAIAWLASVLFAYVTNRRWVFRSQRSRFKEIMKEMTLFVSGRLLSGIGDMIIIYIFVDIINMGKTPGKIVSQVFVVIFNYVFSKLVIFKQSRTESEQYDE